jgi:hypothetical protein
VSTRLVAAVVTLASSVAAAGAESPEPHGLDGVAAPRPVVPASPPADPLSVRLVWVDPARVAVGVEVVARDEARSLLRKMGLSVSWRRGEAREVARPGEVRVILLDRGAALAPGTPILGATPTRFEVSPFVWVHVPSVRAAMGLRAGPFAALDPPCLRAFAVALGRVVVHEVVHALAPSVPHGTGLMSEKLTHRQLTAGKLAVDPEVVLAVRAALRGEPSLLPDDAAALAAATAGQGLVR